ncbi:MAG TPA: NAD(P)-binding domain-containing protein [Bryobacteraceae bacterium]|nr:NAD(P)-binding domain-containing protein [Bryobacteraceae bacterium]
MSTVVFLGGGRITYAMLAGLRLARTRERLVAHDRNAGKLRDLKKRYAVAGEPDLSRAVRQADVLIVAVRPSSIRDLLRAIGEISRPLLAVSLAAGVPLHALRKAAGPPVRWARAMPSPVCRSGRGLTAVTFPRTLPRTDRKRVRDLFATFGQVIEIPESKFDAFTVTYSCSHGYHALATLARAAQAAGLDRKTALLASAHSLADGIIAWREGNHSLESLLAEAATPGGIAAATATAMDAAGYGRAVRQGLAAGLRRARANARK